MNVYLESGQRRVFAVALDWPGWARGARDEDDALEALVAYGPRYLRSVGVGVTLPDLPTGADLTVVERLTGNATTDFGAPGAISAVDRQPATDEELERLIALLRGAWKAFVEVADAAQDKSLGPSGPRGGGRSLDGMREHVRESDASYISAIGGRRPAGGAGWAEIQEKLIAAIHARARGDLPDVGPRGGERWPARYAIRRIAWHSLDHTWEIEDRVLSKG